MVAPVLLTACTSLGVSAAGDLLCKCLNKAGLTGTASTLHNTTQAVSGGMMGASANSILNAFSPSTR